MFFIKFFKVFLFLTPINDEKKTNIKFFTFCCKSYYNENKFFFLTDEHFQF